MRTLQNRLTHTDDELASLFDQYVSSVMADADHDRYAELTRLAVQRHVLDRARSEADAGYPYYFDLDSGLRVCRFVELMPHIEGRWEQDNLYLGDWQVFWYCTMFGWLRRDDDRRRFTDVYIEVGRKNAKSTGAAPVALYMLTCDGEPGPLVLCAATTGDQAAKVFRPAAMMARKSPVFRDRFRLEILTREIRCHDSDGLMMMVNSESSTQDGHNPYLTIFDELHAHKTRDLYDVLHSSGGARKGEMYLTITTAGINYEGVCYEQRKLCENMLRGAISLEHMYALIFTLDDGDDPYDEKVWGKANPMLYVPGDVSKRLKKSIRQMAQEARASAERENEFKRKRMNVWLESGEPFFNADRWRKDCTISMLDFEKLKRLPCYGGLDLSAVKDFTSFALAWMDNATDNLYVHAWLWLPATRLEALRYQSPLPFLDWRRRRYFDTTEGDVTDYGVVEEKIMELSRNFRIQKVCYDPWNAPNTAQRLLDAGIQMEIFTQSTANYNHVMKTWDRRMMNGTLKHMRNDLMTWMVGSVVKREDDHLNIAPSKKKSISNIDGVVAGMMASAPHFTEAPPAQSASELVFIG